MRAYFRNGGRKVEAAKEIWAVEDNKQAAQLATEVLKKQSIRTLIKQACYQAGLTPEKIAQVLSEAVRANKFHWHTEKVKTQGRQQIKVVPTAYPDHDIRLKAADISMRVLDAYPSNKVKVQTSEHHKHLHVELRQEDPRIVRFIAMTGRYPSEYERLAMRNEGETEVIQVTNIPDEVKP